ncbi:MAG TPA: hypothetical protein VJ957_08710, partial [Longimicrobiales bacterium]|nr:hypothetical protein [Longimicrobiales bacterium]
LAGWLMVAVVFVASAANLAVLDGAAAGAHFVPVWAESLRTARAAIYDGSYLAGRVLRVALPALLLFVFVQWPRARWLGVAVAVCAVAIGLLGVVAGDATDWQRLLGTGRVLSVLAMFMYLLFSALYLLSQLPLLDRYLGSVMLAATALELAAPVPTLFLQAGSEPRGVWVAVQLLYLAAASVQLVFVWRARRALDEGGVSRLLRQASALG